MSIQSIGSPPARADRAPDAVAFQPAARAPAVATETSAAVQKAAPAPTLEQVNQAVSNINKSLQTLSQDVVFSVDNDSNRTIVKVVDQRTKEVIRQIPSPEALEIAKALDTVQGLLIRQTA
jgi:flagellar protein FlaG